MDKFDLYQPVLDYLVKKKNKKIKVATACREIGINHSQKLLHKLDMLKRVGAIVEISKNIYIVKVKDVKKIAQFVLQAKPGYAQVTTERWEYLLDIECRYNKAIGILKELLA